MPHVYKILGCPGAGKTTYLLNRVEEELANGVEPQRIGYFSFTRKAADEARDRAILKFPGLNAKSDFPYFRTLHSLAFKVLGARKGDVMQPEHYAKFSELTGIEVGDVVDDYGTVKTENPIINAINMARLAGEDLRAYYNKSDLDIEWHHFEYVDRALRHFKDSHNLIDFTDMLNDACDRPELLPELDVVIVDEAQDLSRMQWKLVHLLIKRSARAYVASDADQALYLWAGADIDSLFALEGETIVLEQSWRVPAAIHRLADSVVRRIRQRFEKKWLPRDYEGEVHTYASAEHVPLHEGEWLVLASSNYLLKPIAENLRSRGLLYEKSGYSSVPETVLNAVYGWERLRAGKAVPADQVACVYRMLPTTAVKTGHRTFKGDPDSLFKMDDLRNNFGLTVDPVPWFEALTKIGDDRVQYIRAMVRRGTKFSRKPQIILSTIHGAKGGEADHVMLMLDLTTKFINDREPDDVLRMLYVALTRSKKTLHLVLPKDQNKAFML
jgi:DNA helicase-2/ATP-dependent DNA helicase PcrA